MRLHSKLLWIFVIIWQPTLGFYNLCPSPKNLVLSSEECADLYFEFTEKATDLGRLNLELEESSLKIIPLASEWTTTFLKVSSANTTDQFCSKLIKSKDMNFYCFSLTSAMENQTFQVDYKIEKLPDISYRRFIFSLPKWKTMPFFLYVDQTDTSVLILRGQKLLPFTDISYFKVEAYKEKDGNVVLQDFRFFPNLSSIYYELFTYNDVGGYYFVVSAMNEHCGDSCVKMSTPKIFIGKKSTRVVIGIVGASFILPFILFIFHVLTRKYPEANSLKNDNSLVVAYKSSNKKHNDVVSSLAIFLEKTLQPRAVDVVDLSKISKKTADKFCADTLILADSIVYVTPPRHDASPTLIEKMFSEKVLCVVFDYCVDQPQPSDTTFRLFEDFSRFLKVLNITEYNTELYNDLLKKTEEAMMESGGALSKDGLPTIIITEAEPQERDSLISSKEVRV